MKISKAKAAHAIPLLKKQITRLHILFVIYTTGLVFAVSYLSALSDLLI